MKKIILLSAILSVTALAASADEYTDPQTKVVYTYEPGKPTASVKEAYTEVSYIGEAAGVIFHPGCPDATGDVVILDRFTIGTEEFVVTSIGKSAFEYNKNITSVSIPNTVTDIGESAFEGCFSLVTAKLPEGLTHIPPFLFSNCNLLVSAVIPSSVRSIDRFAFCNCSSLANITLPKGLTYIGNEAFSGTPWYNKQYDEAPDGPFYIGPTLVGYKGDKPTGALVIKEGTTCINYEAFSGCPLTSVTFPASIAYVESNAFDRCTSLTAVFITDLAAWCRINFDSTSNPLSYARHLFLNGKKVTNLVIPESVSKIGTYSFNKASLTSVTIPDGVKSIGYYAFSWCDNLTSVNISEGVDSIDIDNSAFTHCKNLTSITIPARVKSIGTKAFYNCWTLDSVTSLSKTPFAIADDVFEYFNYATLYVPMGCKARYETTAGWKRFAKIVEMGGTLGDANSDGNLTVADMTAIAHHVLGITPDSFSEIAADANQDDQVNVADYTAVAHLLLYGSITRPEGSGSIGADASQRRTPPTDNMEFDNTANSPFRRWEASAPTDAGLDNMVYIAPMKAVAGEELTLSVRMRNSVDAEGYQFNLFLPAGVTLVTDAEGKAEAFLSEERTTATRTNMFATSIQPDGSLTVMAASTNASVISTGDGEVCTVKVRIADDMAEGDYPMLLKCIAISDTDAHSHDLAIVETTITICDAISITSVTTEATKSEYVDLQGRRITGTPNPGIYIENGRKRVVSR